MHRGKGSKGGELSAPLPGFEHINRFWDRERNQAMAKILPGEYYVTTGDELIGTVLGSCVSACVRDRLFGIGGMNHFMLPMNREGGGGWGGRELISSATRYGNYAMEHMINDILKHGAVRSNLEVKLFGVARVISGMSDVGERNIAFVRDYLHVEKLSLVAEDLGGVYPRKIVYAPSTGKVQLKRLHSPHNDTIVKRETDYSETLRDDDVGGDIELFTD